MLKDQQNEALVRFCDAIAALCAPIQDEAKLGQLREQVDIALALMEAAFPLSLQVSCLCLVHRALETVDLTSLHLKVLLACNEKCVQTMRVCLQEVKCWTDGRRLVHLPHHVT